MIELPPQESMRKARDHMPIEYVPATQWHCGHCEQDGGEGAGTTVDWIGLGGDGPDGRCKVCGQLLKLARMNEHLPEAR